MSNPRFPDPFGRRELLEPGATASGGGLSLEQRVAALEQGAASKTRPILYYASMYLANSGAPTHTSNGGFQKVGAGGGTSTWTSAFDVRPSGVTAQVDTTNKRINIQKSGIYLVTASVYFTSITSGKVVALGTYVNGVATGDYDERSLGVGHSPALRISVPIAINAGQYLEMYAYQNDSISEAYIVSVPTNKLTAMYIGPSV